MLAAAILAAGESKRMGQPKALVPFQGSTFVEHLIAATRHARVGITRVVLGAGAEGIRAQLKIDPGMDRGECAIGRKGSFLQFMRRCGVCRRE